MENLIKLHKTQLHSDRTSCRSPLANQVRLLLHTGAYWLLLKVRDAIPQIQPLAVAEFKTIQAHLIKIGARITETAKRVRVAFAAACPKPTCSSASSVASNQPDLDRRGFSPVPARSQQPPAPAMFDLKPR